MPRGGSQGTPSQSQERADKKTTGSPASALKRTRLNWPAPALQYPYSFALLGRFHARTDAGPWPEMESRRLQQLVAYLLLFRSRPQHRGLISSTLWSDSEEKQARKNLRQSVWRLQRLSVQRYGEPARLLVAEKDWLQVDMSNVWLDVSALEDAYDRVRSLRPELLTDDDAEVAMAAVDLYRGDLLEGWEEKWCFVERVRLEAAYTSLLEKLLGYCEAANRLETGLAYGDLLLKKDPAHEPAHRRVMRLRHLAGDRTGALRQFERCRSALERELGVGPGHLTRTLYEEIRGS